MRLGTNPQPFRHRRFSTASDECVSRAEFRSQSLVMAEDDEPIRGQMRRSDHRRVSHGLFLRRRDGISESEEFQRDLRAWLMVLPPDAVFTHVTAARLRGWHLPEIPEQVPVFASIHGDQVRPRRPGLICSRLVRPALEGPAPEGADLVEDAPTIVIVPRTDAAPEVLLRASRDLGVLDVTILIDSAFRAGDLTPSDLDEILDSRRPGVRILRQASGFASPQCRSVGETVLRVFHHVMEVDVSPLVLIYDDEARLLGEADLLVNGTNLIHEYDGAVHRGKDQHKVDLRRERGGTARATSAPVSPSTTCSITQRPSCTRSTAHLDEITASAVFAAGRTSSPTLCTPKRGGAAS